MFHGFTPPGLPEEDNNPMPRAVFNDTMNVYSGPDTPFPGVLKSVRACRKVLLPRIAITNLPFSDRRLYVTYIGGQLVAGATTVLFPTVTIDLNKADEVEFQSNLGQFYRVLFNELITPRFGAAVYRRSHLAEV